jgi:iron complex outermembrane recepter protein
MKNVLVKLKLAESLLIPIASCAVGLLPLQAFAADVTTGSSAATPQDTSQSVPHRKQGNQGTETSPAQLQEVVVTGYAASLEKAIEDKFKAPNITDGISSEGIGQFPEQNLAESLQRVTGVQITRDQGEGQYISVRGLDPKFTDTLYNGRQLPSGSGTRAFDFQVLSGNFADRVDVYKSPTADLPESGLAATVNIQSIRPLDYGKERAVVTAEGLYDQQARDGVTPHVQGLYTNTFFDHHLGWIVAVDLNERNVDDQSTSTDGAPADSTYTGPGTQYRLFSVHSSDQVGLDRRLSAMSMLQLKVNDALELRFDTLDSEFTQAYNWYEGNNFYPGAFALGPETTLNETVNQQGVETAWEGTNVFAWLQANRFLYNQKLTSNALAATLRLAGWKVDAEGSFGQARETTTNMYVSWATAAPGATLAYNTNQDPGGPVGYSFVGYNQNDISNYYFFGEQGEYDAPTTDKIWNFKLDAMRPLSFGWLDTLQLGANYEDRSLGNRPNGIGNTSAGFASDMSQYLMMDDNPTWFSSYGGAAQFPKTWLTVNLNKFYANYPLSSFVAANPPVENLTETTLVEEKSSAGYAQLSFANGSSRLTGNAGVRFVHTEELSSGYVPAPDALLIYGFAGGTNDITYSSQGVFAQSNSYNDVLPDLNLTYKWTANLLTRFAAAQVMQRPDMNLLAESSSPNASSGPPPAGMPWLGTLSEGNPNLRPYRANQFDVSLEWYFGPRSLLAGDFFLKDVKNLVLTNYFKEQANVTLGPNLTNSSYASGTVLPISFSVAQPQNAQGTTPLKGVEIAWQQPFDFLPGFLDALGAEANYTHIWTQSVVLNEGQPALPVTGVSANTYNAGLYYDTGRFGVHANYNYRSRWVSDPLSFFNDGIFVQGYGQLDIAGSYNLTRWLNVSASVINATQAPLIEVDRFGINRLYELSGRRFYLGLHATF